MKLKDLMKFDPVTGEPKPYPSHPKQYRAYHGEVAWLFNPYTGTQRDPRDIGSDVFGHLICGTCIKDVDSINITMSFPQGLVKE